jgi:hypothetical protein
MNKVIAAYLRLSQDDDAPGESNSIVSQRHIIQDYVVPELAGLPTKEFIEMITLSLIQFNVSLPAPDLGCIFCVASPEMHPKCTPRPKRKPRRKTILRFPRRGLLSSVTE